MSRDAERRSLERRAASGDRAASVDLALLRESEDGGVARLRRGLARLLDAANSTSTRKRRLWSLDERDVSNVAKAALDGEMGRAWRSSGEGRSPRGSWTTASIVVVGEKHVTLVVAAVQDHDIGAKWPPLVNAIALEHEAEHGAGHTPLGRRDFRASAAGALRRWADGLWPGFEDDPAGLEVEHVRAPREVVERWLLLRDSGELLDPATNPGEDEAFRDLERRAAASDEDARAALDRHLAWQLVGIEEARSRESDRVNKDRLWDDAVRLSSGLGGRIPLCSHCLVFLATESGLCKSCHPAYAAPGETSERHPFLRRLIPNPGPDETLRELERRLAAGEERARPEVERTRLDAGLPAFYHDCDACIFLGHFDGQDLYVCGRGDSYMSESVVSRWSSDAPDYSSFMASLVGDMLLMHPGRPESTSGHYLDEAWRRALAAGLLRFPESRGEDLLTCHWCKGLYQPRRRANESHMCPQMAEARSFDPRGPRTPEQQEADDLELLDRIRRESLAGAEDGPERNPSDEETRALERAVQAGDWSGLPALIEAKKAAGEVHELGGVVLWRGPVTGKGEQMIIPPGQTVEAWGVIEPRQNKAGWGDPRATVLVRVTGARGLGWAPASLWTSGTPEWFLRMLDAPELVPRPRRGRRRK